MAMSTLVQMRAERAARESYKCVVQGRKGRKKCEQQNICRMQGGSEGSQKSDSSEEKEDISQGSSEEQNQQDVVCVYISTNIYINYVLYIVYKLCIYIVYTYIYEKMYMDLL